MFLGYRIWLVTYGNDIRTINRENYYNILPVKNPKGRDNGSRKVFRSKSQYDTATTLHVATRLIENSPTDRKGELSFTSGLGFRFVSNEEQLTYSNPNQR